MRKHVSGGSLMRQDIILKPASSIIPAACSGSANAFAVDADPTGERIDVGPALKISRVSRLHGRPYPIQFRNQGAFEAWKQALGNLEEWARWADPKATCWSIRQEIQQQLNSMRARTHDSMESAARAQAEARMQAVSISANLKYGLQKGAIIEATPALETLLLNSDMDLHLPMKMVAPPYLAQYLRFGPEAVRHLKVPESDLPDRFFDGVFCFFTPPPDNAADGGATWTLELIFVSQRQDCYSGQVALLGETERDDRPLGEWLNRVLDTAKGRSVETFYKPMYAAVSYVVKVFLYMALRQARSVEHREYDEAMQRISGLGVKKRARLLQRAESLYNGIRVGPEDLVQESAAHEGRSTVAPHWRRGHFRMQACGLGKLERKLIFVAPMLIHAAQLQGDIPAPKPYRAGSAQNPAGEVTSQLNQTTVESPTLVWPDSAVRSAY
jgi:hypothetical protein